MDPTKKKKIGKFRRTLESIRTRYALMTAFFLLLALAMFYVGGRIVLVHFISDTERQVKDVGLGVSRLAYGQADKVRGAAKGVMAHPQAPAAEPLRLLRDFGQEFSLVAEFSTNGQFVCGVLRSWQDGTAVALTEEMLLEYKAVLPNWVTVTLERDSAALSAAAADAASTGIVRLDRRLHYVVMVPCENRCLMFGMPFATGVLFDREKANLGGLEIRVGTQAKYCTRRSIGHHVRRTEERSRYGIAPILSEAMDFYSGGFWKLHESPLEAVFAIRDIAGNAVSMVTVALPKSFTGATRIAVGRLAFFIAIGGIFFVLPLFWAQNRILLNPLTKMTKDISEMGARAEGVDCPRLEWEGRDEFAQLAESVNRMVEAIAAKTVSLANSEASHQALIDGVPDGLVVFDVQGRMVSISKQPEGVGPLPGLFPGETPSPAVFGEAPVRAFAEAVAKVAREESVEKVRLKVQRPLGVPKSVPTRHFELRLSRLGARFVLAIVRDVSAEVAEHKLRLAAEQRSLDVSKRESLTGLAAGIAHDMNNVLSVVLNAAEAHDADPSGDSVRALTTIRAAISRGTGMMRELMTFAGENRMSFLRANPHMVMEDVRQLASLMVGKNIDLVFGSAEEAPDVDVDPNQFWKVLFNIIKNAGEAIGTRPGRIELTAVPFHMTPYEASNFVSEHPLSEGDGVLFRVDDDGPGIQPDILRRLFDPYVSSKAVGRGLGLATVRTIVEAHGGGIRVKSVLDKGTTFLIYLPASRLKKAEMSPSSENATPADVRGEILLVDNDESILKTTAILLKAMKLTVHVARDRREALAVVRRHLHELKAIVLDAHLGGIDTVRLLDAFRLSAPKVPVVVSSGSAAEEIEKMFKGHPYDAFLAKPYTVAELKRTISMV